MRIWCRSWRLPPAPSAGRAGVERGSPARGAPPLVGVGRRVWTGVCAGVLLGAALALPASPAGAQPAAQPATGRGTITGRVLDAATRQPVADVGIGIVGTTLGGNSAADGRFTIRNVPAGSPEVRALRVGYQALRRTVSLAGGQTATVELLLVQAPYQLSQTVVTATGEQRRLEVGNAVAQVKAAELVQTAAVSDLSGLLSGRASGVQVLQGSMAGTGSRIRIRGQNSLSLNNNPIVYVDGIRVESANNSTSNEIGGSTPSRFNDLNPEEIESIEIVKGPSAATLYGTDAAAGVLVITTKKGKAGRTQWNAYSELGRVTDPTNYPDAYYAWGRRGTAALQCTLSAQASGSCAVDSLTKYNLFADPEATALGNGSRQQYGLQASGGTDVVQYFLAGEFEDEVGPYEMPAFEVNRLREERGVAPTFEERRPNGIRKVNLRANGRAVVSPKAELSFNTGYVASEYRVPDSDDNTFGYMSNAIGGPGFRQNRDPRGIPLLGYRLYNVGDIFARTNTQTVDRFISSLTTKLTPTPWLTTRAVAGVDFTSRVDERLNLFDQGVFIQPQRSGEVFSGRANLYQWTGDWNAIATRQFAQRWQSKTTVGAQYFQERNALTTGSGQGLPPGAQTTNSGAIRNTEQQTTERKTFGVFAEQMFGLNDRLFLTAAIRQDRVSSFGTEFQAVNYPRASLSWAVSEESWMPTLPGLGLLRLRATYGTAGQQPGPTDAARFFSPISATVAGSESPAVTLGAVGNPGLRPEYSAELESGIDADLFDNRMRLELTYYSKTTRDALIERRIAPSLGGVAGRFENIGQVKNAGVEMLVSGRALDTKLVGLDLTVSGSLNRNKLVELGEGVSPISTGNRATQLNTPGFPLFGLWGRPVSYEDNGDGILVPTELRYGDYQFIGPTLPQREIAVTPSIELFDKRLRVSAQVDHRGDVRKFNNTERGRCQARANCRALNDPATPLQQQAHALSTVIDNVFTGYFEDGSFTRWRELSVAYNLPTGLVRRARASRATLVLTGRNLAVWTDYTGLDPETSTAVSDARGGEDFQTQPPLRYWTVRLNLGF